ncbi:MAG TPA: 3-oxoacyl-ACP synthase [Chloroflexota bacterium]|nr:3-oxoacyl-ACP synthase [Chloroflexota bacterium]
MSETGSHVPGDAPTVGIVGLGSFVPPETVDAVQLAGETGIPAEVLVEKFGVRRVHRAGPDCHVSEMAARAGAAALHDAGVSADEVDLVVYCGSEFKDYIVWSAATKIAQLLGCRRAQAFEVYALCAGTPVTLRIARNMMCQEPELRTTLIVAASKESALVNRSNARTRFMFNFGDGAGAALLRRDARRNLVLGSSSMVDPTLSEDAVMPAGGSRRPASAQTVAEGAHYLDVPNLEHMRTRLDEVSSTNFLHVIHDALQRSDVDRVDFLAPVHMKRSMHEWLVRATGAERALYLEEFGHMQAADQLLALDEARRQGLVRDGDTIVLAAAGVGYTWAATVLAWGPQRTGRTEIAP